MNHELRIRSGIVTKAVAVLITALALAGCGKARKPEPAWIMDPGHGASASAGFHVMGRNAQEELAISRAREQLAARYGVEVSSEHVVTEAVVSDRMYVTSDKIMEQKVKNKEVKAHVRAKWMNPETREIWVWVYPISE